MNSKIIFQKTMTQTLVARATGKNLRHSQTGRPTVDGPVDISISHKEDLVCVGIVSKPYRIGIDIERIDAKLDAKLFFGPVITEAEQPCLRTFCRENNFSLVFGVAIFWSIKEAFFKCLDYDLKPGKISILNIRKNNRIKINCSDEIKRLMRKKKLKLCFARTIFNKKHIYSEAIMRMVALKKLSTDRYSKQKI